MNAAIGVAPATTLVRRAGREDIAAILRVERAAWPSGECMQAGAEKFAHRIALGGVFVAERDDRIVGCLTTFRPQWACADALDEIIADAPRELFHRGVHERWQLACRRFHLPASWHAATADGTLRDEARHREGGEIVFGVGIATDPSERGTRVAQTLLEHALDDARRAGARWFVGYGRLPQYHGSALDLDAYLRRGRSGAGAWVPYDYGFRLHWYLGARPAKRGGASRYLAIPSCMRDDPESRGAGVLIVNPLCATP